MTTTPNLGITLLEQGQAQKEVTINEALSALDAFINGSVLDKDLATPPTSPVTGAAYIVAAGPTGLWAGHATQIAYFNQTWRFVVPQTGARIWVVDESSHYVFNGTAWVIQAGMSGGAIASALATQNLDNIGRIGIGTTDAGNKLSVNGDTVLFNSATGDIRTTLNKTATSNNALFAFQKGFSTRAEFGLAGNDDFTIKVSPDGSIFNNGLIIDRTSAAVTFPNTPGFVGATASVAGGKGLVPAPAAGDQAKYLKGDGTWATVSGGGGISDGDKGDITVSASGATWTVDNGVITPAKMADFNAYSLLANETASTAAPSFHTFRFDASATYSETPTWTGTTAPSGSTSHTYQWAQIGELVFLRITLVYGTGGSALTEVRLPIPSVVPQPSGVSGLTGANNLTLTGSGYLGSNLSTDSGTGRGRIVRNAGNTAFEVVVLANSISARVANASFFYPIN